jgi:predicted transcriptional regulator
MSVSVTLPDDLASRLAHEAERRSMTPDELAVAVLAENIPEERTGDEHSALMSFLGCGESTDGRTAREDEQMLAEGFGR